MAVTRPPCKDDCCTSATMHMHMLATATVKNMYLIWSAAILGS